MIDTGHKELSIERQCELLGLARSSYYYTPCGESAYNLELMRMMDEQEERQKQEEAERKKQEPIPAYVVPPSE